MLQKWVEIIPKQGLYNKNLNPKLFFDYKKTNTCVTLGNSNVLRKAKSKIFSHKKVPGYVTMKSKTVRNYYGRDLKMTKKACVRDFDHVMANVFSGNCVHQTATLLYD